MKRKLSMVLVLTFMFFHKGQNRAGDIFADVAKDLTLRDGGRVQSKKHTHLLDRTTATLQANLYTHTQTTQEKREENNV
jgi:hypothetical protein